MASVEKRIQEEILRDLDMTREISDEELLGIIRQKICDVGKGEYLSIAYRMELEHRIFYGLRRLDVLEDLLADDTITEIMVNGPDQIFIERNGCLEETKYHFSSNEKLDDVIQRIASANNKMANTSHPIVDTRLADGSRVNMVLAPIAVDHSVLSIRKFPKEQITMEKLIAWQALSQEAADFICQLVQSGYNIFVSGGTGSGKTTFLNAMSEFIPKDQRVITIEDSAELQMSSVPNLVRLEARDATMEGKLQVSIRDLVRTSLRMRPDRIVVGECRGIYFSCSKRSVLTFQLIFQTCFISCFRIKVTNSTFISASYNRTQQISSYTRNITVISQSISKPTSIFICLQMAAYIF